MNTHPASIDGTQRWHSAGIFFHARVGGRVRKVPLDAGFSCPNRDGTVSHAGCSFCNPAGSGTGHFSAGHSLAAQWESMAPNVRNRRAFKLAYLQSYSNTHATPAHLRAVLGEVAALPEVAGLCLGTRPDCLDVGAGEARLDVLSDFVRGGLPFVQLDLGLQSADDAVLKRANRGHDAACFAAAVRAAAARGIYVCAHLVHGLPGAGPDDLARSVAFLNPLPIAAVKFHNLIICKGTKLAQQWQAGELALAGRERYVADLVRALTLLRPDICVQRLFADPAPGELLAPLWATDKHAGLALARSELARQDAWQGCEGFCPNVLPDWTQYYKETA